MVGLRDNDAVPLLRLRGVTKTFAGTTALNDVDLEVRPGEIHGLLGENGSGKSTLVKVLAGYHDVDRGILEFSGTVAAEPLAQSVRDLPIEFVYQDLGLIEDITVLENLMLNEILGSRLRIKWGERRQQASRLLGRYGLSVDPMAKVGEIRPVERAQLAIIRAIERMRIRAVEHAGQGLLVLDEPTVFLPQHEVDTLFAFLREISATGSSVLFITHDLDEVEAITDRVTVLRNGHWIGTAESTSTSRAELIRMIVGKELELPGRARVLPGPEGIRTKLAVRNLSGETLRAVNFELRSGEILGLTGLLGSGFEDAVYQLFGAQATSSGEMLFDDRTFDIPAMTPRDAVDLGMALIPADRLRDGIVGALSVIDNLTVPGLRNYSKFGVLRGRSMRDDALSLVERYDVRPRNPSLPCQSLSGGNQQKVVLAKWMQLRPQVLLLHEPTQGVDIGARQQILSRIQDATSGDTAVICASSDYAQLATFCTRVLVFADGQIAHELLGSEITKEAIVDRCYATSVV